MAPMSPVKAPASDRDLPSAGLDPRPGAVPSRGHPSVIPAQAGIPVPPPQRGDHRGAPLPPCAPTLLPWSVLRGRVPERPAGCGLGGEVDAFQGQEPAFQGDAPAVAREAAVGADDSVAGDERGRADWRR